MPERAAAKEILQRCQADFDPPNFTECEQVMAAFAFQLHGFFVDVGANDPRRNSLTFPLEALGWSGVLVEPLCSCKEEGLPGTWRRSHLRTVLGEQPNSRAAALRPLRRAKETSFWWSQWRSVRMRYSSK